jgi:hypothetical protein
MKYLLLVFIIVITCSFSFGQHTPGTDQLSRSSDFLGNHAQDIVYDRAKIYLSSQTYNISGMQVVGTPFLYHDWSAGTILTKDGRTFTGYKLRYDIYDQAVSFLNGKDSLDVNDEIKVFTLLVKTDSVNTDKFTFVNANEYKKEKDVFYYELLVDSSYGQLLRVSRKFVAEGHNGLPVFEGKKVFDLQAEYYYYNTSTKKISRIKGNNSNVSQLLGLTKSDEETLGMDRINFNQEADILNFFQSYFILKQPARLAKKS